MVHELLQSLKLCPGGDVVASVVKLTDLVVFHVIAFHVVPILYG